MRRYGELSKDREPLLPHQFCSDCIMATRGYDFREGHAAPGMGNPMKKAFGQQNRRMLGIGPKQTESLWQRSAVRTKRDVRELTTLARQKAPAAKIAKSLKRTLGATRKKASELGVSLDSRG